MTTFQLPTSTSYPGSLTLVGVSQESNTVQLRNIKQRLPRLRELVAELIREVLVVKMADGPLLDGEKRAYLVGIQEAIAGLDQARLVLGKAIRRIEELGLPEELT